MDPRRTYPAYVLITPARNADAFIEKTIESMIDQTAPPVERVLADDRSTDRTAEIVSRYLVQYPWVEMVQAGLNRRCSEVSVSCYPES